MNNCTQLAPVKTYSYHLAKLIIEDSIIFLPQTNIKSVESVYELTTDNECKGNIGVLSKSGEKIPVYSLSSSLDVMNSVPEKRTQCVVIQHDTGDYAILCSDTKYVIMSDAKFQDIPVTMKTKNMPLRYLCLFRNREAELKLGMVTDSECLKKYILSI